MSYYRVPSHILLISNLALMWLLFCCVSYAEAKGVESTNEYPEVTIPGTEARSMKSNFVDQEYKIYVNFPRNYENSNTTYPAVYFLDGDLVFGMAADAYRFLEIRDEVPKLIIFGIAYGAFTWQEDNHRSRDLTPTTMAESPGSGGALNFLKFIQNELIPFVNSNYKVNPEDCAIVGGSLGGLFTLYVLFHQPELFNRYAIVSPSMWWDNGVIFEYEKSFSKKHSELPVYLFSSMGALEDPKTMVEPWQELIKILENRNYKGLKMETIMLPDETHATAAASTLAKALKAIFPKD